MKTLISLEKYPQRTGFNSSSVFKKLRRYSSNSYLFYGGFLISWSSDSGSVIRSETGGSVAGSSFWTADSSSFGYSSTVSSFGFSSEGSVACSVFTSLTSYSYFSSVLTSSNLFSGSLASLIGSLVGLTSGVDCSSLCSSTLTSSLTS